MFCFNLALSVIFFIFISSIFLCTRSCVLELIVERSNQTSCCWNSLLYFFTYSAYFLWQLNFDCCNNRSANICISYLTSKQWTALIRLMMMSVTRHCHVFLFCLCAWRVGSLFEYFCLYSLAGGSVILCYSGRSEMCHGWIVKYEFVQVRAIFVLFRSFHRLSPRLPLHPIPRVILSSTYFLFSKVKMAQSYQQYFNVSVRMILISNIIIMG